MAFHAPAVFRYVVLVTLSEAETIRRAIHLGRIGIWDPSKGVRDAPAKLPRLLAGDRAERLGTDLKLRIMTGQVIDKTIAAPRLAAAEDLQVAIAPVAPGESKSRDLAINVPAAVASALACFRFLNCEFYYSDEELGHLMASLSIASIERRKTFFEESLRRRRRERNLAGGTPLA